MNYPILEPQNRTHPDHRHATMGPVVRALSPVRNVPHFAVILRCIHERGETQREALIELDRRGLWLTYEQKVSAGLVIPRYEPS